MIKILFDHQIFSQQQYGGISRYFASINKAINNIPGIESEISILKSDNYYLKDVSFRLKNEFGQIFLTKQKRQTKWNQRYSEYKIAQNEYDVLHPTYYDPYFIHLTKKKFVITVHDMTHELYPDYFDSEDVSMSHKRQCIINASHIIAISEATKKDLIQILNIEQSKISVIHHGYDFELGTAELGPEKKDNEYLLYVGDRKKYKNFNRLLIAIEPLLAKGNLRLMCAGGGHFGQAELEIIGRLKIDHYVHQINVSDISLTKLYQEALAFIYPSLHEGFGLPILEAFQNRCPVIASSTSCFKEIGGDAVEYFNPYDVNSIFTSVEQVINNSTYSKQLADKGLIRLENFTMKACIEKTIDVYKKVSSI
jgi:glycosyltransferase involved in cell wall biosynthesis